MKATTWLCPILTLLCAARLVCTAQRGYPLDYADSNMLQNDYLLDKRNKPSLSIVNPLDVLRQRLLLEIARRQMKENTRQVELNRAILKNVGKRVSPAFVLGARLAPLLHQLQQHQFLQQRAQLDLEPSTSFFDLLQRPALNTLENDKQSPDIDIGTKHRLSGNEVGNETNRKVAGILAESDDSNNNAGNAIHDVEDDDDRYNDGYQLRYLYRNSPNNLTTK